MIIEVGKKYIEKDTGKKCKILSINRCIKIRTTPINNCQNWTKDYFIKHFEEVLDIESFNKDCFNNVK